MTTTPSIAQQQQANGLAMIRAAIVYNKHQLGEQDIINVDTISGSCIVFDLADGTTIRLDAQRYPTPEV